MLDKATDPLTNDLNSDDISENMSLCGKISKHIGGIICLAIMVTNWVAYGELLQSFTYNHLYLIRYCAVSAYSFYIIPWYFVHKYSVRKRRLKSGNTKIRLKFDEESVGAALYAPMSDNSLSKTDSKIDSKTNYIINKNMNSKAVLLPLQSTCKLMQSMIFGIIFVGTVTYFCGYLWYVSLEYTMVAANNTIYQSQCVWVLIFSYCFLDTKLTLKKIMAMLIAVGGVAMVSFGVNNPNDDSIQTTWYGYVLCLISTVLYALQAVGTSYVCNKYFRLNFEMADNFLLLTGMGIFTFFCMWPGLFILDAVGIETFILPQNYHDLIEVIAIVVMEFIFIGCYMTGITLSGPILISLGTLSIIPLSFVADVWLHGLQITMLAVIGSLCIFLSFVFIEIPTPKC